MITSSGMRCDVCGIFNVDYEPWRSFSVPIAIGSLHCCQKCEAILPEMKRWEDLPDGPLKRLYQEVAS